jgi:acyl-CoA synthetase (AMP-forming)/AMP-acid ligase II
VNLAHLLLRGARLADGAPAWKYGTRTASYAELLDRVSRLSAGLGQLGLHRGDRVILDVPNAPELLELLWACFWGGYVAVPVNWHLHPQEVGYIAGHCSAAAILLADETAEHRAALPDTVQVLSASGRLGVALADLAAAPGAPLSEVAPADPAWLFYTSGTTGRPKGATLSHRNLMAMTLNYYADLDPVAAGSVFLHAAPLTHGSGLYLLPATGRGATSVIMAGRRFDAGAYLDLLAAEGATHAAFLAPTMLNRILAVAGAGDDRLATLRSVVVGGAPFYRDDGVRAQRRLGPIVSQIYGQGEAPMTITVLRAAECAGARLASCGRPFTGVALRVADPGGAELPAGQAGEVQVRGDVVMAGYWDNPAATAQALAGGWLRTGDIGHLDDDGYLYLTDRAKDVVITGGSNVYPREVEEVLLTHPAVREVAVIGEPDPEWGESVCAVVVADESRAVTVNELLAHCAGQLASFKKPRRFVFVPALPKNATGKVLKRELRRLHARPSP